MRRFFFASALLGVAALGCSSPTNKSSGSDSDRPEASSSGPSPEEPSKASESKHAKKPGRDPLVYDGKHLDEWVKLAGSKDKGERMGAAQALGKIGSNSPESVAQVVPLLAKLVSDDNPSVRRFAAESLVGLGPNIKEAVPALGAALKDGDENVRGNAMKALLNAGPDSRAALPALIEMLDNRDPNVKANALRAIGQARAEPQEVLPALDKAIADRSLGKSAVDMAVRMGEPAVPKLIEWLGSTNVEANRNAALALSRLGAKAKPAVPALTKSLLDADGIVRSRAADALGAIGPDAAPAADTLLGKLQDDDSCSNAARALVKIGTKPEWVPELMGVLKNGTRNQKAAAADVLGSIGKPALDDLVEAMRSNNADTLEQAAYALGKMGADARPALDKLFLLLQDNEDTVAQFAARAIDRIGLDVTMVPRLVEVVKSEKGFGRSYACELLVKEKIRKEGVPQLAMLLSLTGDSALKPDAIRDILTVLQDSRKIPPADARPAVDSIVKLLGHEDEEVKRTAGRALKKIDPAAAAKNGAK